MQLLSCATHGFEAVTAMARLQALTPCAMHAVQLSARLCSAFEAPYLIATAEAAVPGCVGRAVAAILALQLPTELIYVAQLQNGLAVALQWAASPEVAQRLLEGDHWAATAARAVAVAIGRPMESPADEACTALEAASANAHPGPRLSFDATLQLGRSLSDGLRAALLRPAQGTEPCIGPDASRQRPIRDLAVGLAGAFLALHAWAGDWEADVQRQFRVLALAADVVVNFHRHPRVRGLPNAAPLWAACVA